MKLNKKTIILVLLGFLLILMVGFFVLKLRAVYGDVQGAVSAKSELLSAINSKDTKRVKIAIITTREAVTKVDEDLNIFRYFAFVPRVKREMNTAKDVILQTNYLLDSASLAIKIINESGVDVISPNMDVTSAEALKKIDTALVNNKSDMQKLLERGDKIIVNKVASSSFRQIRSLHEQITGYSKIAQQVERLIITTEDGTATLLGLRGEKKYLLMFENSDELRPGGGLISTYGLITLKDGQTSNLFIDHVQNLKLFYTTPIELNPDPIQQTMRHQKNLYIYDANWLGDPNEWLDKIFRSWNAQKPLVDGIIVMSTKILEDVVRRYEPLRLPGTNEEFRADDIVASLDYNLDVQHGLYDVSKYKVLGPLVDELLKNIKSSKPTQLKEILVNAKKRFQSRDLLFYTKDEIVNDALKNNGIQNEITVPAGDEFYALGANLGSGKADGRMKRSLAMRVYAQEIYPATSATITQDYTAGVDDFRASGYYGYLRFFLPLGSKLGAFDNFNLVEDENIIEAGRQVYGNYFSVATGTKKDVAITYALAESVAKQIKAGNYSLTLRKQGGVEMPFEVKINIPDSWKNPVITTSDGTTEFTKNQSTVTWKGILTKDMQIEIKK
ncbi:MAG: DUF4012 domain-containing protein [bacterium]|nr:DUF4012 domain-containing protein [bacterium]